MIYMFLADGFEETEAIATLDVLRRAELNIKTVSIGKKQVTGNHKITVAADLEEKQVTTNNMDAVILPGGMPGTLNLEKSPIVKASVEYCAKNNLYIGAICAAPSILGHMGLLKGKKATCFPGFEEQLLGAQVINEPVVIDGNIVTGKSMGYATEFGLALVKELKDEHTAQSIRKSITCP